MEKSFIILKEQLENELHNILQYWITQVKDIENGGFIGKIDAHNIKHPEAEKGAILHSRILWALSASYQHTQKTTYKREAKQVFEYIYNNFYDPKNGGIYWTIYPNKKPKNTKNQIYALAYSIYGLSEYFSISKDPKALKMAIALYEKIQKHSYDPLHGGYFDSFSRDWKPVTASKEDRSKIKNLNTHLHLIEAFVNLYKIDPREVLRQDIIRLLTIFETHFIDHQSGHLKHYFDHKWMEKKEVISFGHDIEASWLLVQAATISKDENLLFRFKKYALLLTSATMQGIDPLDGGLWYERDLHTQKLRKEKHWWPQTELMIGFFNSYQISTNPKYMQVVLKSWNFIQNHIIDKTNGEWLYGIHQDNTSIQNDKIGLWKCPYHNTRMCIELITRIQNTMLQSL